MPNWDKHESLTYGIVKYHNDTTGTGREIKMYSFLKLDKKGKEVAMAYFRKYAIKNLDKIEFAAIFENHTDRHLETIIENGKLV